MANVQKVFGRFAHRRRTLPGYSNSGVKGAHKDWSAKKHVEEMGLAEEKAEVETLLTKS